MALSSSDSVIKLQRKFDKVFSCSDIKDLDVNMDKLHIVVFRNGDDIKQVEKMVL